LPKLEPANCSGQNLRYCKENNQNGWKKRIVESERKEGRIE